MKAQQKAIIKRIRDSEVISLEKKLAETEALLQQALEDLRIANGQVNMLAAALLGGAA